MSSPATILLVDADPGALAALTRALELDGFRVATAASGPLGLAAALRARPAVVVTEIDLPGFSGLELCRRLRAQVGADHLPVVFLTRRAEEVDRVVAFEVGADDYVTRPCSARELCLRLRALLRRSIPPAVDAERLQIDRITVDRAQHRAWVGAEEVPLTAVEFRLLVAFVRRAGTLVSRAELLHEVWGLPPGGDSRTVDTHLRRLRRKLGPAGDQLITVRGVGYRLAPTASPAISSGGSPSPA